MYFGGVDVGTTVLPKASSFWYTQMTISGTSKFAARDWYKAYTSSTVGNIYEGIISYYPSFIGMAAGDNNYSGVQWTIFQPKWQPDDYYKNNFRLNIGDGVRMLYKDSCTTECSADYTTSLNSEGSRYIEQGAAALTASLGVAFAAAALTF